jgi:hypothetical protein
MDETSDQDLHPLPIASYAISLALSVAYKHMRQSQLVHQQQKAKLDFQSCFRILQSLRGKWWSADVTATLASKVLGELEKVSSLSEFRVHPNPRGIPASIQPAIQPVSAAEDTRWDQPTQRGLGIGQGIQNMDHSLHEARLPSHSAQSAEQTEQPQPPNSLGFYDSDQNGISASFEGIDDIFGAYMDPYFPVNFDEILGENSDPTHYNGGV